MQKSWRQADHTSEKGLSLDREVSRSPLPLLTRPWLNKATTLVASADFIPRLNGEEDVEDIFGINSAYHHTKPDMRFLNQENVKA